MVLLGKKAVTFLSYGSSGLLGNGFVASDTSNKEFQLMGLHVQIREETTQAYC